MPDLPETALLLQQIGEGDHQALEELLSRHRTWIRRIVDLRLDKRLRTRIDPSDVVQDIHLEVSRRIDDYLARDPMPFRLWLRQTAYENLLALRRKHLEAECRSVEKETSLPQDSSLQLAQQLLGRDNAPDQKLLEAELLDRIHVAMDRLSELDREILLLRFFEGLTNEEVTELLRLEPATASKRYGRALLRLRHLLTSPGDEG